MYPADYGDLQWKGSFIVRRVLSLACNVQPNGRTIYLSCDILAGIGLFVKARQRQLCG